MPILFLKCSNQTEFVENSMLICFVRSSALSTDKGPDMGAHRPKLNQESKSLNIHFCLVQTY